MLPAPLRHGLLLALLPAPALAASGFAVCVGVEPGAGGRMVVTARPFAADSARAEGEAKGFAEAARGAITATPVEPACHWEPTRERAADYLRRLRQGAGRKGADAVEVAYAPG